MSDDPIAFQGGLVQHAHAEIALAEWPLQMALTLLRRLGGEGLGAWRPCTDATDGLAVCELTGDGLSEWATFIDDPGSDAEAGDLAHDEEYEGGHYLALREPPLVVAALDKDGRAQALVGLFMGTILWVDPDFRGRGAARAMIVAAAEARGGLPLAGHPHSGYSAGGLASMQAAFREMQPSPAPGR